MRTIEGTGWPVDDVREYIEERVQMVPWSGCWLWERALNTAGYGSAHIPWRWLRGDTRPTRTAHRLSYEAFVGPIPDHDSTRGTCVLHKCDVRCCCNPDHLFLGTAKSNSEDMVAKQRQAHGERNRLARLTESDVQDIVRRLNSGESQASIARSLGVGRSTIHRIHHGETWKLVTR